VAQFHSSMGKGKVDKVWPERKQKEKTKTVLSSERRGGRSNNGRGTMVQKASPMGWGRREPSELTGGLQGRRKPVKRARGRKATPSGGPLSNGEKRRKRGRTPHGGIQSTGKDRKNCQKNKS